MSKKDEISAIDAIYEILEKLEFLDKKLSIIDDNVKVISNKLSKLNKIQASSQEEVAPPQPVSRQLSESKEVERLVLGNIKTYGYIVNKLKQPLNEVTINVYDEFNKLVKNVKTNEDGYWEVRLSPGKYGVEYIHKNFKPINKTIMLEDSIKTYEVR